MKQKHNKFDWNTVSQNRFNELYNGFVPYAEIGKEFGVTANVVTSRVKVLVEAGALKARDSSKIRKRVWTEREDAIIKKLYIAEVPIAHIAKKIGVSQQLIHKRVDEKLAEWGVGKRGNIVDPNKFKSKFNHTVPDVGIEPKNLPLDQLERHSCRFPVNSPPIGGEYLFCGHTARIGKPYCEAHHKLCNPIKAQPSKFSNV